MIQYGLQIIGEDGGLRFLFAKGGLCMPGGYHRDPKSNMLFVRFWGVVVDEDFERLAREMVADPSIGPNTKEFVDMGDVERMEVSSRAVRLITQLDLEHAAKFSGRRTAVYAPTDAAFGTVRMYEMISDSLEAPSRVAVFRKKSEAHAWLEKQQADDE